MHAFIRRPRRRPLKTAVALALCSVLASAFASQEVQAQATLAPVQAAIHPGDDFYTYANGDWLKATEIPADRSSWGAGSILAEATNRRIIELIEGVAANPGATPEAKQVSDFYRAFMDEAGIEALGGAPLQAELDKIAAIKNKAGLTRALGASLRADVDPLNATDFQTENLFGLWVAQGLTDPTNNTPYLLQGGLGMPDRVYYLDDSERMNMVRTAYQAHIAAMMKLAGFSDPETRAARVFGLERRIALAHASRQDSSDVQKANNTWNVKEFSAKAPGLNWQLFFRSAGLGRQQKFIVWHPTAIAGAAALVAEVPLETWKDFLRFHTVNHNAGTLPKAFVDQRFEFYGRTLSGTPQLAARWKRGLAAVNEGMPEAVGKLYVEKYFAPEAKARLQVMVGNIVKAFHRRIDQLDWMAPSTQQEAHAKLDTLYVGVGYPDKWTSYRALQVKPDDAFGNAVRAEKLHYAQQLAKLQRPVDRTEWSMPPQLVNAVNMPMQNALNFPAAILQPPYFDPNGSDAINYGGIGAIIGHEISHSFDDTGAQFDSRGRLRDWWTAADAAHFKSASAALAVQYSAYRPFPDLALNGQLTLSENLADLAGLAASYDAFKGTRSAGAIEAERQFFTGYAQIWRSKHRDAALRRQILTDGHSPGQWRAATVRNLDAWYQAFDVQPGRQLYLAPKDRVRVW